MKTRINNADLNFLLFFIPAATCLMFWIKTFTGSNIEIGSYFDLSVALYLYRIASKQYIYAIIISIITLACLSTAYTFLRDTPINVSFSYLTVLHNILFSLWLFPKLEFYEINLKKLGDRLLIFVIIFIILYELSVPYAKARDGDDKVHDIHRVYKEGFVISHLACYYLAVSGYFLFLLKKRVVAVLLWVYVSTLGPRIGLIYIAVGVLSLGLGAIPALYKFLFKIRYVLLALIIMGLTAAANYIINKVGTEGLEAFTSGRSYFWINAFRRINADGYDSANNIIGRGPKYSAIYNMATLKKPIWMHNDYMDVFFNLGFAGLATYLLSFFLYFRKVDSIFLFFTFLFAAFFNGFLYYDAVFVILLSTIFRRIQYKNAPI